MPHAPITTNDSPMNWFWRNIKKAHQKEAAKRLHNFPMMFKKVTERELENLQKERQRQVERMVAQHEKAMCTPFKNHQSNYLSAQMPSVKYLDR